MVNILRRWNQPIMVVVTVLVIVSFMYFGQRMNQPDPNQVRYHLYGDEVRTDQLKRQAHKLEVYAVLGGRYAQATMMRTQITMGGQISNASVVRSMVIDRECENLGITSTQEERNAVIEKFPALRDDVTGAFAPQNFEYIRQKTLNAYGFSDSEFEHIFLDGEVRARKLTDLVAKTTTAFPDQLRKMVAEIHQKEDASSITFRAADAAKEVKPTDEDLKKYYAEKKADFKAPALRKVRVADFTLPTPADGVPLAPKDRSAQLQKIVQAAYDLSVALETTPGDFEKRAQQAGAKVTVTEFFPENDAPKELDENPAAASAAFQLSKEKPYSKHLRHDNGAWVMELVEIKEAQEQPFDAVKAQVEAAVRAVKGAELAQTKAKEAKTKLEEAMKGGKSLAEAAAALQLTVEPFVYWRRGSSRYQSEQSKLNEAALHKLAPKQLSEPVVDPATKDAMVLSLDYRSALDDAAFELLRESANEDLAQNIGSLVFYAWLQEREKAAGVGAKLD